MILKFKLQYQMLLSLNAEAKMEEIADEIQIAKDIFNDKSQTAQTVKQILKANIENNLLLVTLASDKPLSSPSRALFVFTQSILNILKEKGKDDIITEKVKRKGFFQSIGQATEIKNIKATISDSEKKIDSIEALHMILDIFSNTTISEQEEEVRNEILELLGRFKKIKEEGQK